MASTSYRVLSPATLNALDGEAATGTFLKALASTICTFNLSTLAASSPSYSPIDAISASPTTTNHANIVRVNCPSGANYLDLFHEWTGTTPTVRPKVRVFGRFPQRMASANDGANPPTWPSDIAPSVYAAVGPIRESFDWLPLLSDVGDSLIEIGSSTDPIAWSYNDGTRTSLRSPPTTIRLRGALEVIVIVDTVAVSNTAGVIAGTFGA